MATPRELRNVEDSLEFVQNQIAKALYQIDNQRSIYKSENDVPTLTTKYVVVDNGFIESTSEVFDQETRRIDQNGTEMAATDVVREYSYIFSIVAAKSNPDRYLATFKHRLWWDQFHSTYFGQFQELGIREVGNIVDTSAPIDQQGWENRATMSMTISFLATETEITPFITRTTGESRVRGTPPINTPLDATT